MACTNGISTRLSWVLAALTATASGRPAASVSTCSLEPGLPRSTGSGPVGEPLICGGTPVNPRASAKSSCEPEGGQRQERCSGVLAQAGSDVRVTGQAQGVDRQGGQSGD